MHNTQFETDLRNAEYAAHKVLEYELKGDNDCTYLDLYEAGGSFLCGYLYPDQDSAMEDMAQVNHTYGITFIKSLNTHFS
jgi:hypothetical protein